MDNQFKSFASLAERIKLDFVFEGTGKDHGFFTRFLLNDSLPYGIHDLKLKAIHGDNPKLTIKGLSNSGELRAFVCLNSTGHTNWFAGEMMGVTLDGAIEYALLILDLDIKGSFGEMYYLPEGQYNREFLTKEVIDYFIEGILSNNQRGNDLKWKSQGKQEKKNSLFSQINWNLSSEESNLKQLATRVLSFQYKDRPLVPLHAIPQRPYRFNDSTEAGLIKCIQQFIKLNGGIAERINSMGRQVDNRQTVTDPITGAKKVIGSVDWIRGTSTIGTADVSITVFGLSIKVEIKIGKDRQSQAQLEYQKRIEAAGGIYIVARSFDGFLIQFFNALEKRGL